MGKVVIINGGNQKKSRLTALQYKVEEFLTAKDLSFETIYVHELPADDLITANFLSEAIINANRQVEAADIVVILTPIYKGSFSGILKTYLDVLPQKALERKTIIPIAIGGSIGHLLSIEYALKPVLSILGATEILNTVYVVDQQVDRLENGEYAIEKEAEDRLLQTLEELERRKLRTTA